MPLTDRDNGATGGQAALKGVGPVQQYVTSAATSVMLQSSMRFMMVSPYHLKCGWTRKDMVFN